MDEHIIKCMSELIGYTAPKLTMASVILMAPGTHQWEETLVWSIDNMRALCICVGSELSGESP